MTNRIREIRENKEKTLQWLADQIGIQKPMMSKLEKGSAKLTQGYMEKIAKALECAPWELINKNKTSPKYTENKSQNNKKNDESVNWVTENPMSNEYDPIPLYGALFGTNEIRLTEKYVIAKVPRPNSLYNVKGGFAMLAPDESMNPRHNKGESVFIHPFLTPAIGQDCVIIEKDSGIAVLKRFMGETLEEWKFYQFNPQKEFTIKKSRIEKIFAVIRML